MFQRRCFNEPSVDTRTIGALQVLGTKAVTLKTDDDVTSRNFAVVQSNITTHTATNCGLTAIRPNGISRPLIGPMNDKESCSRHMVTITGTEPANADEIVTATAGRGG